MSNLICSLFELCCLGIVDFLTPVIVSSKKAAIRLSYIIEEFTFCFLFLIHQSSASLLLQHLDTVTKYSLCLATWFELIVHDRTPNVDKPECKPGLALRLQGIPYLSLCSHNISAVEKDQTARQCAVWRKSPSNLNLKNLWCGHRLYILCRQWSAQSL